MGVLLLSLILYLLGIAILLFLRPQFMFHRDGSWKEFGVGGEDTTVFPLWMFCIGWAVVSYGIGRLCLGGHTRHVVAAAAAASMPISSGPSQPEGELTKPGYYKLNASVMRKKGVPRYIYVGAEAPDDLEDDS